MLCVVLHVQVVAYDFGIKYNILRRLASYGCRITVVPATYPAADVLKMNPDGVFFSNGPVRMRTRTSGHGVCVKAVAASGMCACAYVQFAMELSLESPQPKS